MQTQAGAVPQSTTAQGMAAGCQAGEVEKAVAGMVSASEVSSWCRLPLTQCHQTPASHTSCQPPGTRISGPLAYCFLEKGQIAGSA